MSDSSLRRSANGIARNRSRGKGAAIRQSGPSVRTAQPFDKGQGKRCEPAAYFRDWTGSPDKSWGTSQAHRVMSRADGLALHTLKSGRSLDRLNGNLYLKRTGPDGPKPDHDIMTSGHDVDSTYTVDSEE